MTNVNVVAIELAPLGGMTNAGYKLGFIDSANKAAQNDTFTVTNASAVVSAVIIDDSAGTVDACTLATNVITMTGAAYLLASGLIVYKE